MRRTFYEESGGFSREDWDRIPINSTQRKSRSDGKSRRLGYLVMAVCVLVFWTLVVLAVRSC